jgi:outer membrane biosynthesis protein TonB
MLDKNTNKQPKIMAAKKIAKKTAKPETKSAAKAPVKKTAKKEAKKAVKKPSEKPAKQGAAQKSAPAGVARPSNDVIARAAYLNYRRRVERGLPGDSRADWLEAERQLAGGVQD